jgi:cytidyltransferase-like protein
MWKKITHVESSMEKKNHQYELFIGRWQPLHLGHQSLFAQVLEKGGNVCIAVRDTSVSATNPFSTREVVEKIENFYAKEIAKGSVKVIVIPDICSVNFGRGVGYEIVEYVPPENIAEISATKIRKEMGL